MLSGKDKGKTGTVSAVLPNLNKMVIGGLNLIKKNVRARKQGQKSQIISKERPVSISSVALMCKSCGKPTRVGFSIAEKSKIRICKKCGAEV